MPVTTGPAKTFFSDSTPRILNGPGHRPFLRSILAGKIFLHPAWKLRDCCAGGDCCVNLDATRNGLAQLPISAGNAIAIFDLRRINLRRGDEFTLDLTAQEQRDSGGAAAWGSGDMMGSQCSSWTSNLTSCFQA